MSELLPCPFCGSEAEISEDFTDYGVMGHWVECANENCEANMYGDVEKCESVTDKWNTRNKLGYINE